MYNAFSNQQAYDELVQWYNAQLALRSNNAKGAKSTEATAESAEANAKGAGATTGIAATATKATEGQGAAGLTNRAQVPEARP